MTKTYKLAFLVLLGMMAATIFTLLQRPWQAGASVSIGSEYQSTTTPTVANRTNLCPARVGQASSTTGVLGHIVVTSPNIGRLTVYDATTSNALLRSAEQATSTLILADIPTVSPGNATTTGTLIFDATFIRGLLVDYGSSVGTTTITYRCTGS